MVGYSWLVKPLEAEFQARLEGVARRRGLPGGDDVAGLAEAVRALSGLYNQTASAGEHGVAVAARAHLRARLAFSFPRDVPKGAAAVRELVGTGALRLGEGPARVLDVGAGMGAMTFGLARALAAAGERGALDVVYTDADERVLGIATELAATTAGDAVRIVARTARSVAGERPPKGPFDVILVGQVLSELDESGTPSARLEAHLALCEQLFSVLAPSGALVIVEPALRDRTRHLHALRDAWLARGRRVFAPCLHGAACPALASAGDWCHEDLPVDLPPWLVPVARTAGLRWEGLSLSYLVLRRDGLVLADVLPAAGLRVVSSLLRTKGKSEAFLCGELSTGPGRGRFRRLDRHATAANAAWDRLAKGAILERLDVDGARVEASTTVRVVAETP